MNTILKHLFRTTLIVLSAFLLTNCDGEEPDVLTPTPTPTTPNPGTNQTITFTPSVSSLEFPASGGTQQFSLHTSSPASYSKDCSKWITVESSGETQVVTVNPNTTGDDREGYIKYYHLDSSKPVAMVKVIQKGQQTEMICNYELKPNTQGISQEKADLIKSVDCDNHEIQWSKSLSKEELPAVGQKIILGIVPGVLNTGLLAKVNKVTEHNDYYAVDYTPVQIGDCFEKLEIKNLSIDMSTAQFIETEEGMIDLTRSSKAHDFEGKLPVSLSCDLKTWYDKKVALSGGLGGSLEVWADFKFDGMELKTAKLNYKTNVDMSLSGSITMANWGGNYAHHNLGCYTVGGTVFMAGEIPIAVFVHVPVDFVHKYEAKICFEIGATYSVNQEVCHYFNGMDEEEVTTSDYGSGLSSFTIGPKVEGSYQAGFGIGPVVSLYHLVGLGGTKTFQVKTTASSKIELNVPEVFSATDLTWTMQHTNLSIDYITSVAGKFWTLAGSLNTDEMLSFVDNLLDKGLDDMMEVTVPLRSYSLIPTVSSDYTAQRNKEMVTLTLTLNGQYFLLSGMRVKYEAIGDFQEGEKPKEVIAQFELNSKELYDLQSGNIPSLDVQANAKLDPAYKWGATVEMDFSGTMLGEANAWFPLMHIKELDFGMLDPEDEEAIREILRDILNCKDGKWEECNWTTQMPVDQYKFVSVIKDGDFPYVSIYIPDYWKLKDEIIIKDHTSQVSKLLRWELYTQAYSDNTYQNVEIYDSHCSVASIGKNVKRFVCKSPMMGESYLLPDNVEEAIIPGSQIKKIKSDKDNLPYLSKLDVSNCPNLTSIIIEGESDSSLRDIVAIGNTGCPSLNEVKLKNINVLGSELNEMIWPSQVSLTNCQGSDLTLTASNASQLTRLDLDYAGNAQLSIDGCSNLTNLRVHKGVKSLNLNGCNALNTINCLGCNELKTFTYKSIPALRNLNLQGTGIIAKVPQLFDDMKKRSDCTLAYDTLYRYWQDWEVTKWEKRDHGYYYDGEPEQGYHGPHVEEGWQLDAVYKFVNDGLNPAWADMPFDATRSYENGVYTRTCFHTEKDESVTATITTLPEPASLYQPGDIVAINVNIDFSIVDDDYLGTIYYPNFPGIFLCNDTRNFDINEPISYKYFQYSFRADDDTYYWPAGPDALDHRNFTVSRKMPKRYDCWQDDFWIFIVYDDLQWVGWHYSWNRP